MQGLPAFRIKPYSTNLLFPIKELSEVKKINYIPIILAMALSFIIHSSVCADVLEPYDGMPLAPWSGALALYPTLMKYPDYEDENYGDIEIDMTISGAALKGQYNFPKIADKFSWAALFVLPYYNVEADDLKSQSGLGDPGLGIAFWPYEDGEKGIYHSLWFTAYFPWGEYDEESPDTSPGIDAYTFVYSYEFGWYHDKFAFDGMLQYWQYLESDELKIDKQDAVEADMLLTYTLENGLMPGFQASLWWDTEDLKIADEKIPDTQGYRFAGGPKISYMVDERWMLSLSWLHDFSAENHVKGDWIYGRILYTF